MIASPDPPTELEQVYDVSGAAIRMASPCTPRQPRQIWEKLLLMNCLDIFISVLEPLLLMMLQERVARDMAKDLEVAKADVDGYLDDQVNIS